MWYQIPPRFLLDSGRIPTRFLPGPTGSCQGLTWVVGPTAILPCCYWVPTGAIPRSYPGPARILPASCRGPTRGPTSVLSGSYQILRGILQGILGSSGGSPRGVPWGDPPGDSPGASPGGIPSAGSPRGDPHRFPRGPGSIVVRFWVGSMSILGRFLVGFGLFWVESSGVICVSSALPRAPGFRNPTSGADGCCWCLSWGAQGGRQSFQR